MSTFTKTNRWMAGAALLALIVAGSTACGSDDPESSRTLETDTTASTEVTEPTDEDTAGPGGEQGQDPATQGGAQSATQGGGGGVPSGGGQQGGGQPGGGQAGGGGGAPQAAAPVITSFEHPDTVDCHNGNFQYFTMRWSTTGADSVTISIDGPGIYDTYGPSGETGLPFSCDTPHTFLLTAHGPGGTTSREVTLHGRNVQGSSDPEDVMDQQ